MMQSPRVPGSHFLPTVPPEETLSKNPLTDLHAFPSHVNSSFLPPELDLIKNSIDSFTSEPSEEKTDPPLKNIYNFPPNVDSVYLPPRTKLKSPTNSYLPIPSGDDSKNVDDPETEDIVYDAPGDLNSFPPNNGSAYPKTMNSLALGNSYLPPPSGDKDAEIPVDNQEPDDIVSYIPPNNLFNFYPNIDSNYAPPQIGTSYLPSLVNENVDDIRPSQDDQSQETKIPSSYIPSHNPFNFPPNIESSYLPPEMRQVKQSVNSYLPPASGSVSGFYEGSNPTITDAPQMEEMAMAPPPPEMMMMDMASPSNADDHHHHEHDHPPW